MSCQCVGSICIVVWYIRIHQW